MKLKLKEEPREWLKFTAVMALALALAGVLLHLRNIINRNALIAWSGLLAFMLALCWIQPKWFRGFYRGGMRVTFQIGQIMGGVILTLFFLLMVTPLGLLLRLCGKDLLKLKRNRNRMTYWEPAKTSDEFDRMF